MGRRRNQNYGFNVAENWSKNNIVERLHGARRERNKIMGGLKDKETASTIMDGKRIYYNFIRPHGTRRKDASRCGKSYAKTRNKQMEELD
jgi:transposase-like protein